MRIRNIAIGAALLGATLIGSAHAAPMIDWDPAFMWEIGAHPTNSPTNGEFKSVGVISRFGPPFEDLNANLPAFEYTFYMREAFSLGTQAQAISPTDTIFTTTYDGGIIEIFEDSTPDASFDPNPPNAGVPTNFIDGTPILVGFFFQTDELHGGPAPNTPFIVQTNNFTAFDTGNAEGPIEWTGGTLLERLNQNGTPCPGLFTGALTWYPPVMIPGYLFRHDGKIDHNCPTMTNSATWGRIKQIYR
ncbi:MAG TPA: hypothetical protein VEY91_10155 [Candidatus Limnocylindria bacterium]|nr:hypothetical protein [Candidatus Limnocylindria bacterium]